MSSAIIGRIGILILAIAVAYGVYAMDGHASRFVKNNAIDGCYATGQIIAKGDSQDIVTPENYWFTACMNQKGYQIQETK